MVARAGGPVLCVAAALLAGAGLLVRAETGPLPRRDLESIVVEGQMARARTIPDADVLILGDSSALMGIDADQLGRELGGKRVESLATIGFVGPAGFAHLLDETATAGHHFGTVVLVLHGVSLALDERVFGRLGFEAMAEGHEKRGRWPTWVRDAIYDRWVATVLDLPLPGSFGRSYGRPADLAAALREHHGSLVDPNTFARSTSEPFRFQLSPAVATRLDAFASTWARRGTGKLLLLITPIPESRVGPDTLETRATTAAEVQERLGGATQLPLPASMPDADFASLTHLDAEGRARYTALLARELERVAGTRSR